MDRRRESGLSAASTSLSAIKSKASFDCPTLVPLTPCSLCSATPSTSGCPYRPWAAPCVLLARRASSHRDASEGRAPRGCGTRRAASGSELEVGWRLHGPRKLGHQRLGELLVDGHVEALAPCDGDPRVVVVDLGGPERNALEFVLHVPLLLGLDQPLLEAIDLGRLGLLSLLELRLDLGDLLVDLGHLRLMRRRRCLLVIAQHRDVLVGDRVVRVVCVDVPLPLALCLGDLVLGLRELGAERDRRVVRTEDLGRQSVHHRLEVIVEVVGCDLVEELVGRLLALHKLDDHLVNHGVDGVSVVVDDRVLAEKVEVQHVLARIQLDVLHTQRAAADRVRLLIRVLLVADTQRKPVDEVDSDRLLLGLDRAHAHALVVVGAHLGDVLLERARLLVLGHI
mmetsp:Transcript_27049/g.68797  ORF Transcript_27049/g.68797 Transcript_27049/m.68797 type:complete len:396 (-) Transcript_27049:938-2125(-)